VPKPVLDDGICKIFRIYPVQSRIVRVPGRNMGQRHRSRVPPIRTLKSPTEARGSRRLDECTLIRSSGRAWATNALTMVGVARGPVGPGANVAN
jgi:hypothetical protein